MTRKNPFVRMSWIENYPHLVHEDVAVLQSELKRLYPTLVMFPRAHHFHELGAEPRQPEFIHNLVEHFMPRIGPNGRYLFGQAVAVRVPWPEDIATANPQRLIGRPHRKPFDDSKEAFHRFGRTVYFQPASSESMMLFCGITVQPPSDLLAAYCDVESQDMPPFRYLGSLGGFHVEMPYDTEDPEVVTFVKSVLSIISRLTTRIVCVYDGITSKPIVSWSGQPKSRSYMRRCALESDLYLYCNKITYNGHPLFTGPTPVQRRKWRREAGLPDDTLFPDASVRKLLPHEYLAWCRANARKLPSEFGMAVNRLANRAMYEYVATHAPNHEMLSLDAAVPTVLPEHID